MQDQKTRRPLNVLLRAIDTVPTIDKLFVLVKNEHIAIRLQSRQAASDSPARPQPQTGLAPMDFLRQQVRDSAIAMYRDEAKPVEASRATDTVRGESKPEDAPKATDAVRREQKPDDAPKADDVVRNEAKLDDLLKAIDACPTIDKLFELVKREHIVIQMKSQQAASNIPLQPLPQTKTPPLERLRQQVRDAAIAMYRVESKPAAAFREEPKQDDLLKAIDTCPTIDKLFELVKREHIVIQMKSQQAASNIPFQPLPQTTTPPLERLREQVREAAVAMIRSRAKAELIRAVETCPTIDKLFELVKNEHIVIQMKSQNSASCLPRHRLTGEELAPDTTPLERLRQQVLEAVIYG